MRARCRVADTGRQVHPVLYIKAEQGRRDGPPSGTERTWEMSEAYIVAAARTAGGRKGGRLKGWHPVDLGAEVINALLDRSKADPNLIEDVICGCVSQVGEQAIDVARNAVLASRLPEH